MKVWTCKIGGFVSSSSPEAQRVYDAMAPYELPYGADLPMRRAVAKAYLELTGQEPQFIFSGWGGTLSDVEFDIVQSKKR